MRIAPHLVIWLLVGPAVAAQAPPVEAPRPVADPQLLSQAICNEVGGKPRAVQLWAQEYAHPGSEQFGYHTMDLRVEMAREEPEGDRLAIWQDLPALSVAMVVMREMVHWRGVVVCGEKPGEAHLLIAKTTSDGVLLMYYRLRVDPTRPVEPIDPSTLGRARYPVDKRPRPDAWHQVKVRTPEQGPWAVDAKLVGRKLMAVLGYESRALEPRYFELSLERKHFTPLKGDALRKPIPLPRGAATGFGVPMSPEETTDLSCSSADGHASNFSLRRRELASPHEALVPEEAALLTLSRRTAAGGEELVWASSRLVGRGQRNDWITAGAAWCSLDQVVVFALRTSVESFAVSAYEVQLNSAAIGTLPSAEATPWEWISKYWGTSPTARYGVREPSLAESVRGLKVGERNGKPFIELMHDPPEGHLYDLTYDPAMNRFEKVPVGSGGPL